MNMAPAPELLVFMSVAPAPEVSLSWLQLRPLVVFTHQYFDCLGVPQVEWKTN